MSFNNNPAPINSRETDIAFWNNYNLKKLTVAEKNPYVKAEDGLLYSIDGKKLVGVPAGKTEVTILDSVETIGMEAFSYWTGKEVTLPENVTTIENKAFKTSKYLEAVKMGSKVETIDSSAFNYSPWYSEKLTITINRAENSVRGYENGWGSLKSKEIPIEVVWTGTSGS